MRAVVSGAGIAGLALAHQLAGRGWDVAVVERAPGPRDQGYMLDCFGPGYAATERMGLLPQLEEVAYRVGELAYVDESGRRRAGTDYTRFARALGGRLLSLLRSDLERVLREAAAERIDLRFGCRVDAIEDTGAEVRAVLSDGTELRADLLVGADGVHSGVRRRLFGPEERFLRHLGLHTAAYTFREPSVRALVGDRFCLTDTVDRMMGFYALRDGRVAAFAVHRTPAAALPDDPRATLRRVFATAGWVVPAALEQCPPAREVYYDQVAQVEVPSWHRGRVALLGDACYAVSLLAGQGASLAMAGACLLAEQLAASPAVPEALHRYQERWHPVVTARQRAARRGLEWFLPSSRARLRLRGVALGLTALPGLGRYAGRVFVGSAGSAPG